MQAQPSARLIRFENVIANIVIVVIVFLFAAPQVQFPRAGCRITINIIILLMA